MDRRELLKQGGVLAALGLAGRPLAAFGAEAAAGDAWLLTVDPQLRPIAKMMRRTALAPISAANLAVRRQMFAKWRQPRLADVAVEQRSVKGLAGQPEVTVFVINPRPGAARPGILHTHGGGFVSGTAEQDVPRLQALAKALDCAIVTVDYRLAPETRWTGSVEDNYAGLLWLHAAAAELGVDPARIAVMGESAGGGHAALLALKARDRGEVPLAFQCLTYPMLDDRTGSTRAVASHMGLIGWDVPSNRFGWASFLGMAPGGARVPAAAVPARRADLTGLPPAFIGVGGIDLFMDEDIDYARRLNDAGVAAQLLVVPGAFHGFDLIPGTRIGAAFVAARLDALKAALLPQA